jgi:PAS domain S-box-containing protein
MKDPFASLSRAMLESFGEGVVGLDDAGVCRFVNHNGLRLLGRESADGLVGQAIDNVVHWAARGELPPWESCFERLRNPDCRFIHSDVETMRRADDTELTVEIEVHAIRDAYLVAGYLVLLRDITDRSRQSKAFHTSVKSFRALFDSVSDAILFLTRQGLVVDTNTGVQRIYGISQQAFIGKSIDNIAAQGRHERTFLTQHAAQVFESKQARHLEFWSRTRSKQEFPAEIYFYPADYFGQRLIMAMVHDITDRKRHETEILLARDQARQASRMKSQFMQNMSHEIRTPLNGIIGMADLLMESDLNEEQRDYARTVGDSGRGLLGIVNNILDLARLESQDYQRSEAEFFLPTALEGVQARFQAACAAKGLVLRGEVAPELEDIFVGDEATLAKALGYLVDNAVKFTPTGEVVLSASLDGDAAADGQTRARIAVRDTGIGIDAEKQARIFDAFVQGDGSATREHGGLGLGLSIARYLVAMLGGELRLNSTPGAGSEFYFSLPLKRDQ